MCVEPLALTESNSNSQFKKTYYEPFFPVSPFFKYKAHKRTKYSIVLSLQPLRPSKYHRGVNIFNVKPRPCHTCYLIDSSTIFSISALGDSESTCFSTGFSLLSKVFYRFFTVLKWQH